MLVMALCDDACDVVAKNSARNTGTLNAVSFSTRPKSVELLRQP
jgi:hypothetical protein